MRMISRKQALEIVDAHGWGASDCTVSHEHRNRLSWWYSQTDPCESFYTNLGIHDQYAITDVKHWLGY